ncbi:uncharacterized protein LOC6503571 isoform X1 [Drosophila ananassae]|uniref:uncharacterized protein LOC6503571 isoform X1 n=1 Tax=Drosophila ananassae TaxID=7217 RepID=UPI0013A5EC11|nr:uncharacterized protein LOC6503571 isoform X1 [Drosophila ananassae]
MKSRQATKALAMNCLILVTVLSILEGAWGKLPMSQSAMPDWRYSDHHYTSAQYAKILGDSGLGQDKEDNGLNLNALQIQYVDYQPHCMPGGIPVCATNGTDNFYFENECHLEAHNLKMLFQHGTELEPTDLERCTPPCHTIKCTKVSRPVCALAEIVNSKPQTFVNECEMKRYGCESKLVVRILHQGPCQVPTTRPRKPKNQRRHKPQRPAKSRKEKPQKIYILLATTTPKSKPFRAHGTTRRTTPRTPRITTSTTTTSTTTPSPMKFQQIMNQKHPMVSVSRAESAYNVYNIPDVGQDYEEITDSTLSMFLPEVGHVTAGYSSSTTTSTTSTTSTTTENPLRWTTTRVPSSTEEYSTTEKSTTDMPEIESTIYESNTTQPMESTTGK